MEAIKNSIQEGGEIVAYADINLYSKDAVFKCLYWYGDKFHVSVTAQDGFYRIALTPQESSPMELSELNLHLQKLERDLIDFNLRDIVTKETKNVRDLLIAKAFSNGEFDELPPGEISDPVGFHLNN
jgi:His-Xaa-Ser system protein HxsD